MTYKHKDHMEWLLQKTDYYTENAVTEERIHEIREVYAKAEAWDDGRDKIYSKISYIITNTEPDKITPGYVNGMYHALDLLNGDVPDA